MKRVFVLLAAIAVPLVMGGSALAYHGAPGGHLPPTVQNVDLVSKLQLTGASPDRFADVAVLGNYAYVGRWGSTPAPTCPGGVTVVDITNPAAPREVASITAPVGTYQTEGMHAIHLDTPSFRGDVLVVSNERCGGASPPGSAGGISIYDVTNPAAPQPLVIGFGDREGSAPIAHQAHSSFAWDAGDRAFVSVVDNAEIGEMGIDIIEITDPRNPRILAESGLANWPAATDVQSAGVGADPRPYHHDSTVRRIGDRWIMVVSYWDAGQVLLDVTDPANPRFIEDSTYPSPDPLIAPLQPEGNAHQAEWNQCPESNALPIRGGCTTPRWIIGTDEDFSPFRLVGRLTSGSFSGQEFPIVNASGTPPITDTRTMTGPTYFVGLACTAASVPAAPATNAIAVVERGVCTFQEKLDAVAARGYQGGIVFNSTATGNGCEVYILMAAAGPIPFVFTNRSNGFRVLNIPGYNPANCRSGPNPTPPAEGTRGSDVNAAAFFDGWTGGTHLYDANTLAHLDTFIIPEALDRRYTDEDFGILSIHEVAADPTHPLGYYAWYSAGLIVLDWRRGEFVKTGQYIDPGGNDFWGTQFHMKRDGRRYIVTSDRNYGLFVFRYGTDLGVRARASANRRGRVTWTLRARNTGTITSTGTVVRTRLPRGVRFLSATTSRGRCTGGRTVVCTLGRVVEDNAVRIRIVGQASRSGRLTAVARVTSPDVDYDPRNNRARAGARVRLSAAGLAAAGTLTGRPR